ncbi:MAG: SpoIIE family protein phosphatase [Sphingobacteriaceae bacterium]|nr:SpoIIE family protein phosphatase [Sphingobacteriaceae bacterium]
MGNKNATIYSILLCDSTGHGVPGAFMSLLNIGFLSEAINEKNIIEPSGIFDHVRKRLISGISKEGQKDGFDGILMCLDKSSSKIKYVGANNAPILIRNSTCIELELNKMPVGIGERSDAFAQAEIRSSGRRHVISLH